MPLRELGTLLLREGKRRILLLAGTFWVVAIAVLLVGVSMPKKWDASTLIVTDSKAIIKPLLEGRAVPTTIADLMPVVSQTMVSSRILREIVVFGGWSRVPLSAAQEDRLVQDIKKRIKIETQRDDAVKISYFDSNAARAYQVTNKLAEIFIRECTELKGKQSRDAYEFIARRVQEYQDKLSEAHEKLLAYYQGKGVSAAAPVLVAKAIAAETETAEGADGALDKAIVKPKAIGHISSEELAELRVEEATLKAQLDDKRRAAGAPPTPAEGRQAEDAARARTIQLQAELDRLTSTYTEQHPDVVKTKRELKTAQEDLVRAQAARKEHDAVAAAVNAQDSASTRALSARLTEIQDRIAAATGKPIRRHASPGARPIAIGPPADQTELEMRTVGSDAVLSEMVRRYNATKDVYEDLFKRRENARVSMDLDSEHRGLTLRVQEAAELPVVSSSVRLMYVALGGLVFALAVPLLILFALVKLDPRVRSAPQIERVLRLPLLAAIPGTVSPVEKTRQRTRWILAGALVVGVFVVYAAALVMKMQSSS
jgi:capsular polysaccharide biosynthesis protein